MKQIGMIIFFAVVLFVYALLNYYVIRRGWLALHASESWRYPFLTIALFCAVAYPGSRFLEHTSLRLVDNAPALYWRLLPRFRGLDVLLYARHR